MSGRMPWVKITLSTVGCLGLGYILMRVVTPTPEELYNKMAPDLQRKVDATRAQRLAAEHAIRQQAVAQNQAATSDPDAQKPVWAEQRK